MLSSWFGLEPIPICSIDLALFSGWGQSPAPIHRPGFGSCRPPVDLSRAGSAKLGALDRSQGRSGVSPFGARLASPLPALEPPDGLSHAPSRPRAA